MRKIIRRIYGVFTTAVLVLTLLLAALLVGVRLVGLNPYTVLSGSMEPVYHVGSLLYVRDADPMAFAVGDPVTYRSSGGAVVTHRIYEVVEENGVRTYRTKGDANDIPDGPRLTPDRIIGRPVFSVPLLGYVSYYVLSPPGLYIALAGFAFILLLNILIDWLIPQREPPPDADRADEKT